jgi:hypothetical protein
VPANALKKRSVLASILRNLGAPFGGGKTVIAGARLTCTPIDLSKHANQYRTERGWFGDARWTLKDLPVGDAETGRRELRHLRLSRRRRCPPASCSPGRVPGQLPAQVTGIPVNRKADALVLSAHRPHRPAPQREGAEGGRTARDRPLRDPLRGRPGGGPADLRRGGHRRLPRQAAGAACPAPSWPGLGLTKAPSFTRRSTPSSGPTRGRTSRSARWMSCRGQATAAPPRCWP